MVLEKRIIQDYKNGKTYRQIKADFHVSNRTIAKILDKNDIKKHISGPKKLTSTFSQVDQLKICSLYKSGLSTRVLAEKYKCSQTKILHVLKINSIARRSISKSKRLYSIDESVFDDLNEFSLYWIGFLMADGNLYINPKNSRQIQLSLHERDRGHIEKFKKFLKTDKPIYSYVSRRKYNNSIGYIETPESKFCVNSKIIFERLESYGLTVRKSKTAKFTNNIKIDRHVIRGLFDGDGSILIDKRGKIEVSLVGSKEIVTQVKNFLGNKIEIEANVIKNKSIFRIRYTGIKGIIVAKFLYSKSNIYLDRKKETVRKLT